MKLNSEFEPDHFIGFTVLFHETNCVDILKDHLLAKPSSVTIRPRCQRQLKTETCYSEFEV